MYIFPVETDEKSSVKTNGSATNGNNGGNSFRNFFVGLMLGVFAYVLVVNREKVLSMVKSVSSSIKGGRFNSRCFI